MQKTIRTPQFFFIVLAFITFIFGLLNREGSIPLAVYNSSIDLKVWSFSLITACFFILIAVNYTSLSITKKPHKKWLTIIHIVLQVIALIPLLYFMIQSNIPKTYDGITAMNAVLMVAFVIFLLATFIHLINFIVSLIAKKD